jgi:tetratricopeptide (TPR) repeat protein
MKSTFALLALMLSASAAPALAQYRASRAQPSVPEAAVPDEAEAQPAGKAKALRPSKGAQKALVELQKVIQANNAAAYPTALAAAKAVATTNEDRYLIAQMQLKKALADKDDAAMAAAINDIAATGVLDVPTTVSLLIGAGTALYTAKQYDHAAASFERAASLAPSNRDAAMNLAKARLAQGRKAEAAPLLQKVIAADLATGRKPEEAIYRRAFAMAYEARLPVSVDIARQWVVSYPSPTSWRNALAVYLNLNNPETEQLLNLMRLMRTAGALENAVDVSLYANAAFNQGNYSEAQAVIDEGLAKQTVKANDRLIKEVVAALSGKPKATLADLETATKDAKTAAAFVRIGDRYFGLGNYAKAIELYRMAEGKAGADANLINMHLGMALARSGDKAGALEAFKKVTGPAQPIAQFWTIYVNQAA